MNRTITKISLLFAVLALLCAPNTDPVRAQATVTKTNQQFDFPRFDVVSCTGEVVQSTGTLHVVQTTTIDANGGYHQKTAVNYMNFEGTGMTSGLQYHANATGPFIQNYTSVGAREETNVVRFHFVSQTSADNFFFSVTFHYTITPDGKLTGEVVKVEEECRG